MRIDSLEQEALLSNYRDVTELDSAGHVRLVRDLSDGRLKVMKRLSLFDRGVYEFLLANPGPNRSRVLELIPLENDLYVVEEYVSGKTLRALLREEGVLPEGQVIHYLEHLCRALRPLHAHSTPIVHRDLKPENIVITSGNEAIVVDFNSAKHINRTRGRDTTLLGTPGYAAPEQYGFRASGPAADIYAIGVLMHEMLTGKMPDEKRYHGRLKIILARCLALDPAMRYESVDALLDEVRQAVQTPEGRPASGRSRPVSRNRSPAEGFRSWLPPGMRGRNPLLIILSLLGYAALFVLAADFMLYSFGDLSLMFLGVVLPAAILAMIFWAGDYRGVARRLTGHTRLGSRPLLRAVSGVLLIALIAVVLVVIIVIAIT